MADDLDRAIRQIAQMFGGSQSQGSGDTPQPQETSASEPMTFNQSSGSSSDFMDSLGLMSKAREMLDTFNHVSDNRINLIRSIQPFLGPTRQQRCTSCIQILKIIAVLSSITPNRTNLQR